MSLEGSRTVPLFLFGTLMPGELYYSRIAYAVAWYEPAATRGILYDTGVGYPAALFGGQETIRGFVVHLRQSLSDEVLAEIDKLEDEGNETRRVRVRVLDGLEVFAYEWNKPVEGLRELAEGWRSE